MVTEHRSHSPKKHSLKNANSYDDRFKIILFKTNWNTNNC